MEKGILNFLIKFLYIFFKIYVFLFFIIKLRFYIGCRSFPECKNAIWFPPSVLEVSVSNEYCQEVSINC